MRRETFKFWDLVRLILETLQYLICKLTQLHPWGVPNQFHDHYLLLFCFKYIKTPWNVRFMSRRCNCGRRVTYITNKCDPRDTSMANTFAKISNVLNGKVNTLRPKQNVWHFADDIFICIFMNENFCTLIWISLKSVHKGPIDNKSALVQVMAWHQTGDKPLPEAIMTRFTDAYIQHSGVMSQTIFSSLFSMYFRSIETHSNITFLSDRYKCNWMVTYITNKCDPQEVSMVRYLKISNVLNGKINTLKPKQNVWHFADDIFKCVFMNEIFVLWFEFHWSWFLQGQIYNKSALVQVMARHRKGDKPLPEAILTQFTDTYMWHYGVMS